MFTLHFSSVISSLAEYLAIDSYVIPCAYKVTSKKVQYPVIRSSRSSLYFTPRQTWSIKYTPEFSGKHTDAPQLRRNDCSYEQSPLSIARYSFIQLSQLERRRVKNKLTRVLTPQQMIRTRVPLVESPKLYPWATALCGRRL